MGMANAAVALHENRFVLEVVGLSTDSVLDDAVIMDSELVELKRLMGESWDLLVDGVVLELDGDAARVLATKFLDSVPLKDIAVRIRPWMRLDNLPYKVHTNRELVLMLSGTKPLAVFTEDVPDSEGMNIIPEQYFAPYVESGRFVRREISYSINARDVRTVLYALKEEAWRIEAWLLMKKTASRSGWSEGFERMEGSLLGYQEWQNDAYINLMYRQVAS